MKPFITIMGVAFLFLVMAAAIIIGYLAYTGNKLDASSKAYVDNNVPSIVSNWSKDELIKRASPQLRQKITDTQLDRLFTALTNKLGAFQTYDGAKGESMTSFTLKEGKVTTASYIVTTTFQNGKAIIQIELILYNDSWQILGFHVELKPL